MKLWSQFRSWSRAMFRREKLEGEMDAEIRFHLDSYTEDLVRRGVPRSEAERRARIEFGGTAAHKEDMRASLGLRFWDDLRSDLRYAGRMLRNSPAFTAVAVLSLALGIGANTAIFSMAERVLLDRLGVPHPEQLRLFTWTGTNGDHFAVHHIWGNWNKTPGGGFTSSSFSYTVFQQLRRDNKVLEDLFAVKNLNRLSATIDGNAEGINGELVSGNYYQQVGVEPALGRALQPSDDGAPGSSNVAVISDGFWARRFGRSPSVVGKVIIINLQPTTIVGVNPPGFTGVLNVQSSPDVFVPFSMQPALTQYGKKPLMTDPDFWWVLIMARAKPGVPDQQANAAMDVALDAAVRATITLKKGDLVPRMALLNGSRGLNSAGQEFAQPIYVLMSLVGFVLLLACVNLANLLLARSAARQREMSVRTALGATRGRIVRQVLTESLTLSAIGGLAGLGLGYFTRNMIPSLWSRSWKPQPFATDFDWRVLAFVAAVSVFTGLLFGIFPAWQAFHTEVNAGLKEGTQSTTGRRKGFAGKAIVGFQVALSTILVISAGLFLRTLHNLNSIDPGFRTSNVMLFSIEATKTRYPAEKSIALHRQIEQKVASMPGVESAALSSIPLVSNSMSNDSFVPSDRPFVESKEETAYSNNVGENFFSTMRIPIVQGRGFGPQDTETSPLVAVVNRALVKKFFPNTNPIGKTFTTDDPKKAKPIEIVGVCADTRYANLRDDPPPTFYQPFRQLGKEASLEMTYEVATRLPAKSIVPELRRAVQSVDDSLPLMDVRTQEEQIEATLGQERIFANLTMGFGILALTLACVGIYGVVAYGVARRIQEFGIRLALGARRGQVLGMVLNETSRVAVVGIVAGVAAAIGLTRFLRSMLYGLKPSDPFTLAGAGLLLMGVALLSGWGPARRASRVQPMQALKHE